MGLQITDAAALIAPGAPDHLIQQLPGALGGARITITEPEIGIDHTDQIEPGKMMPLGHELGADDDIDPPFGDLGQSERMVSIEVMRSLDSTMVRASGNKAAASSCNRSTPGPTATRDCSAAQCGHVGGRGIEKPQ